MSNEAKLIAAVQPHVPDEPVVAAGWFEPFSRVLENVSMAGFGGGLVTGVAGVAAGAPAAERELERTGPVPPAVILAVTATKLYAFLGNADLPTTEVGDLWRTWERAKVKASGARHLYPILNVEETDTGHAITWQGSKLHSSGPRHVFDELVGTGGD